MLTYAPLICFIFQGKDYRATLFLLPGVAGLSGGTLRIPNAFLTQVAGGRNVVYSTSILLCIPMIIAGVVLSDSDCPFNALIACALLSGVGGGAFASSMSNISFYYPKRLQGMVRRELFFAYSICFCFCVISNILPSL